MTVPFRVRASRFLFTGLISGLAAAGCAASSAPSPAVSDSSAAQEEACPTDDWWTERAGPFQVPIRSRDGADDSRTVNPFGLCPAFTTSMFAAAIPQIDRSDRIFEIKVRGNPGAEATGVWVEFESTVVAAHHRLAKTLSCDCSVETASCTYFREDKAFGASPPYSISLGKGVSVKTAVEIKRLFDARAIDAPDEELQRDWGLEEGIDRIQRCGDRYHLEWSAKNTGGSRVVRLEGTGKNAKLKSVETPEWSCGYPEAEPID